MSGPLIRYSPAPEWISALLSDPLSNTAFASRLLNEEDAATLDTVALAYRMAGDHEAAVKTQQRAIELLEAGGFEVHEDFRERLQRYEDATGRTNN